MNSFGFNRRQFLQTSAMGAAVQTSMPAAATRPIAIVLDPTDSVASAPASRWAAGELAGALAVRGAQVRLVNRVAQAADGDLCIVASGNQLGRAPSVPEALALGPAKVGWP